LQFISGLRQTLIKIGKNDGGQRRDRTADAGLFRAGLRQRQTIGSVLGVAVWAVWNDEFFEQASRPNWGDAPDCLDDVPIPLSSTVSRISGQCPIGRNKLRDPYLRDGSISLQVLRDRAAFFARSQHQSIP
jgi:hypothetical protein